MLRSRIISSSLALVFSLVFAHPAEAKVFASAPAKKGDSAESPSVNDLYSEGDTLYERGEFLAAAERWTKALGMIEENEINRSTRTVLLINALSAFTEAFLLSHNPEHLRKGSLLLDEYVQTLEAV